MKAKERKNMTNKITVHSDITQDRLIEAIEADDNIGFCIACSAEQFHCEPDARKYECEDCGEHKVYGAEELLLMGVVS